MAKDDQRRSPRVTVDLPARIRTRTVSFDGRARNLSPAGMLFLGGATPDHDARVEIDLPDGPCALLAEVRWCVEGAAGVHFTERGNRRLMNFVMERAHID
ncbi:MAG TPA: PilZ domain-containing protein [Haliangiales bacterium]|nr:PilZ domain-containing protein [Haliangiales bacterium]